MGEIDGIRKKSPPKDVRSLRALGPFPKTLATRCPRIGRNPF